MRVKAGVEGEEGGVGGGGGGGGRRKGFVGVWCACRGGRGDISWAFYCGQSQHVAVEMHLFFLRLVT